MALPLFFSPTAASPAIAALPASPCFPSTEAPLLPNFSSASPIAQLAYGAHHPCPSTESSLPASPVSHLARTTEVPSRCRRLPAFPWPLPHQPVAVAQRRQPRHRWPPRRLALPAPQPKAPRRRLPLLGSPPPTPAGAAAPAPAPVVAARPRERQAEPQLRPPARPHAVARYLQHRHRPLEPRLCSRSRARRCSPPSRCSSPSAPPWPFRAAVDLALIGLRRRRNVSRRLGGVAVVLLPLPWPLPKLRACARTIPPNPGAAEAVRCLDLPTRWISSLALQTELRLDARSHQNVVANYIPNQRRRCSNHRLGIRAMPLRRTCREAPAPETVVTTKPVCDAGQLAVDPQLTATEDWMRNMPDNLINVGKERQEEQQRPIQMENQMRSANVVQTVQGGNSSIAATPQVVRMASPERTSSQKQVVATQSPNEPQFSAMMGSAGEVDLRENIFQLIKSWKDAYFSGFMELDRLVIVPEITQEQFQSLPGEKAQLYKRNVRIKKMTRYMLQFLQLQKNNVHEGLKDELPRCQKCIQFMLQAIRKIKAQNVKVNIGHQTHNCREHPEIIDLTDDAAPFAGGRSRQQQQQEQPTDASCFQLGETVVTSTPPAHQQNHSDRLIGLQSSPTNKLELCTPSPISMIGGVAVASSCTSVKHTLSGNGDSMYSFVAHDNAAAPTTNGSNQVTPIKQMMSTSPIQVEIAAAQAENLVPGVAETPVAKKPIDRLIDALKSSSPTELCSAAKSIWSVVSISDSMPHGKIGVSLDWTFSQQLSGSNTLSKMNHEFDITISCSESPPQEIMDDSCTTFGIKRQKTQNAKDDLLEEIKALNNTLIDTVISITGQIGSHDGGTMIKLSYSAVSLAPSLRSLLSTSEMTVVMPAKLIVPANYPRSSPLLVDDKGDDQLRKMFSAISDWVEVEFQRTLRDLPEPRSIRETARAWDACVRSAVTEFAHRHGGGTISSRLGRWER